MLTLLWNIFLGSRIAKVLVACVALLGIIKGYGLHEKYLGKEQVKLEAKKDGEIRGKKSEDVRNRVTTDDKYFTQRLRKYCRDC